MYYQHLNLSDPFTLVPTSFETVLKLLEEINPSGATGLYGIAGRFLRDGAAALVGPIAELCDIQGYLVRYLYLSVLRSAFHDLFGQVELEPLFKKGAEGDPRDYRPVSLLPQLSEIVEKTVRGRVRKYLDEKKMLYKHRSGFRAHHSADTCLPYVGDWIHRGFENGMFAGVILIDLQGAFDTVDHEIFLDRVVWCVWALVTLPSRGLNLASRQGRREPARALE